MMLVGQVILQEGNSRECGVPWYRFWLLSKQREVMVYCKAGQERKCEGSI